MHIVIAVITAVAGLFWALNSLQNSGFRFSSLNPFLAVRRWQWRREFGTKPIYRLHRPMDAAAVLLVAMAKADGAISAEQKQALLSMFREKFEISTDEASHLLLSTTHLMRDELSIVNGLDNILELSATRFEPEQVTSLLAMMRKIASMDGSINTEQQQLLDATEQYFARKNAPQEKWR
ncbi:MAG: TerB family tellurite resistance protein [Candidatus Obscuribacterales bacterium]|nr:TerB family tellurite resistance protein [Steroidobacteraceae bacterium]